MGGAKTQKLGREGDTIWFRGKGGGGSQLGGGGAGGGWQRWNPDLSLGGRWGGGTTARNSREPRSTLGGSGDDGLRWVGDRQPACKGFGGGVSEGGRGRGRKREG
ncbi:hypothetical protein TIFTF001_010983 [Ficus carica]|uniref:Uncharacterized protein n=1 Tax=Ficus carica TaxID=3494 RepID=A0AA88DHT0_FICCA|nr:hypothetical protein TIFTF001_010983 [Ficus carica]